jgi:hypothetical protein
MGGTGLEPVTPSLSNLGERSRPFAPVREKRIVKPNLIVDRTPERTRADAERCHCCHAPVSCQRLDVKLRIDRGRRRRSTRRRPIDVPVPRDLREPASLVDVSG